MPFEVLFGITNVIGLLLLQRSVVTENIFKALGAIALGPLVYVLGSALYWLRRTPADIDLDQTQQINLMQETEAARSAFDVDCTAGATVGDPLQWAYHYQRVVVKNGQAPTKMWAQGIWIDTDTGLEITDPWPMAWDGLETDSASFGSGERRALLIGHQSGPDICGVKPQGDFAQCKSPLEGPCAIQIRIWREGSDSYREFTFGFSFDAKEAVYSPRAIAS